MWSDFSLNRRTHTPSGVKNRDILFFSNSKSYCSLFKQKSERILTFWASPRPGGKYQNIWLGTYYAAKIKPLRDVSRIQRIIDCQPEKNYSTGNGGQSRSWSAKQGKYKKKRRESLAAHPPPPALPQAAIISSRSCQLYVIMTTRTTLYWFISTI